MQKNNVRAPKQVTRGLPDTKKKLRDVPNVNFSAVDKQKYNLLSFGWDTVQENFDIILSDKWLKTLEIKKIEAQENGRNGNPVIIDVAGESMAVMPSAWRGYSYLIQNDDLQIGIGMRDWGASVKYLSAGLWEHGIDALRERARLILAEIFEKPKKDYWQKVSRCDFCFDVYSPEFTRQMKPAIMDGVCSLSRVKERANFKTEGGQIYMNGTKIETLTIGSKANLQVEVYDKSLEIRQKSQKTWFYEVWGNKYETDVWRVEIRFSGKFLKNRGILSWEEVADNLEYLLTEALISRRIAIPSKKDQNRSRWEIHPLWRLIYAEYAGTEMLKLGRRFTMRRDELAENIRQQIAGSLRCVTVLASGGAFDFELLEEELALVMDTLKNDKKHRKKIKRAAERYQFIDEAA